MDSFEDPLWNLDQIIGWALSRDPEVVRGLGAASAISGVRVDVIIALAKTRAKQAGRNLDEELWNAEGGRPAQELYLTPIADKRRALESGLDVNLMSTAIRREVTWPHSAEETALLAVWLKAGEDDQKILDALFPGEVDDEAKARVNPLVNRLSAESAFRVNEYLRRSDPHGPPWMERCPPFPIVAHVTHLFRRGMFLSQGNLPGDPTSRAMSTFDWAALEIAQGGDRKRYGVWRVDGVRNAGSGDFENVRVPREQVLAAFPVTAPKPETAPVKPATDDELRALIRQEMEKNGGYIAQEIGADIVRAAFPHTNKKHVMKLVKSLTGKDTRGRNTGPSNYAKDCA
jgi:hypothetical protein